MAGFSGTCPKIQTIPSHANKNSYPCLRAQRNTRGTSRGTQSTCWSKEDCRTKVPILKISTLIPCDSRFLLVWCTSKHIVDIIYIFLHEITLQVTFWFRDGTIVRSDKFLDRRKSITGILPLHICMTIFVLLKKQKADNKQRLPSLSVDFRNISTILWSDPLKKSKPKFACVLVFKNEGLIQFFAVLFPSFRKSPDSGNLICKKRGRWWRQI
mmetsp:Transcript_17216/g.39927  ORF Transcript_17216/g.39927 Transcript_17216/m.39927 type:complete len:212 (-) Transcript_17216:361-996(-)